MTDKDILDSKNNLLFGVRKSIRYHNRRRNFFDSYSQIVSAFSVILGSSTIFSIIKGFPSAALYLSAALTILSVFNLVIGSARQARIYNDLEKRFISLEKKIITTSKSTLNEEKISELISERLDIEADEPPVKYVLSAICHNDLARSMGYKNNELAKIYFYQRWFAQFIDIQEHTIRQD